MNLQKIHNVDFYKKLIDRIKSKTPFLDESYVVSSRVRARTQIFDMNASEVADILYGKEVYQSLIDEERKLRQKIGGQRVVLKLPDSHKVKVIQSRIRGIQREIKLLIDTFKYAHPLSSKVIIGYHSRIEQELHDLYKFKQGLTDDVPKYMRSPIMQIQDGELTPYRPGNNIDQHEIGINLKPYYSKSVDSHFDLTQELNLKKLKCLKSLKVAKSANQNRRCTEISLRLNEIEQFIYLIESLGNRFELYGQKLNGVKTSLRLNERLIDWPDCLVSTIKKSNGVFNNVGEYSVVNGFEIQTQSDIKIPALALGRIHIFTENLADTKKMLNMISPHQLSKFRPFSLYKKRLNSNYPLHNSIWWPEDK